MHIPGLWRYLVNDSILVQISLEDRPTLKLLPIKGHCWNLQKGWKKNEYWRSPHSCNDAIRQTGCLLYMDSCLIRGDILLSISVFFSIGKDKMGFIFKEFHLNMRLLLSTSVTIFSFVLYAWMNSLKQGWGCWPSVIKTWGEWAMILKWKSHFCRIKNYLGVRSGKL